jgi:hypothetical protein
MRGKRMTQIIDFIEPTSGMIGHKTDKKDWDMGDAWQRTFSYILAQIYLGEKPYDDVKNVITKCAVKTKQDKTCYIRSPYKGWWSNPWTMSRDNFECGLMACVAAGEKTYFNFLKDDLKKRYYFTWNYQHIWPRPDDEPKLPDFIFPPRIWAYAIRIKESPLLLELFWLHILDLQLLTSSVLNIFKDPNNTSNDLNHVNRLVLASMRWPTLISKLATWVYKFRKSPDTQGANNALKNVFYKYYWDKGYHPPMYLIFNDVVDKLYKKGLHQRKNVEAPEH